MRKIRNKKSINRMCRLIILLFVLFFSFQMHAQNKIRYDEDQLATLTFGPEKCNGFRVYVSLVALFTTGAADRNGFRLGAGIILSQTIDNWTILTGLDMYKARQKFGLGTSFAGLSFDDGHYGASYSINQYYQGDKQTSGMIRLHLGDFRIHFEDDILAYPFVGFKIYDRYRSAALELRYRGFLVGTNVYTTDINGLTDASLDNEKGVYLTGKQLSSPIYLGYATNGLIARYGINHEIGGLVGQNYWHQSLFGTPDFKSGNYKHPFLQVGVDQPYTLY